MMKNLFLGVLTMVSTLCYSQFTEDIRINQEGYFQFAEKIISVKTNVVDSFFIKSPDLLTTYYSGVISTPSYWTYSNENISVIDISTFTVSGEYVAEVKGLGYSSNFEIKGRVGLEPLRKSLKAYYYMRCSSPVLEAYGENWVRNAGHADTAIVIHASAASASYPIGTIVSSPKGWYDAGDYNKYMVNSGISTYTLLATYEQFPQLLDSLKTNIPESGNSTPDILDEIRWNLDWMLTMQDPSDGGVYHKLTSENFDVLVLPENGQNAPRYMIQKTTSATLDFAAVMATAARVYAPIDISFSNSCLAAATSAWNWATVNSNILYNQSNHNAAYSPNVNTGSYDDNDLADEFIWAAAELYITTLDNNYYNTINWSSVPWYNVPSWKEVGQLPIYSLLLHKNNLTSVAYSDTTLIKTIIINKANELRNHYYGGSAHKVTMGQSPWNFTWGSNGVAGNQGMLLTKAFELTGDYTYLNAAVSCFDYLLGRNATNYCFVTGLGNKPPLNPHHRPSVADITVAPIPGMVVGGPQNNSNPGTCTYTNNLPATKYLDDWCSYSTNEIAINWNAPFVFLCAALQDHFLLGDYNNINLPPNSPLNLTANGALYEQVNLSWTDNANDEHGYKVYRQNSTQLSPVLLTTTLPNVTNFEDTTASYGNVYFYYVHAQNFNGLSDTSSENTVIVDFDTAINISAGVNFTFPDGNTIVNIMCDRVYSSMFNSSQGSDSVVVTTLLADPITGIDTRTECKYYTWINGVTYTSNNNSAVFNMVNGAASGCDSLVTLNLTIASVNTNVSVNQNVLSSDASGVDYQWLICDHNMSLISGAIYQTYTPVNNGDYAVEITENGCTDTSACQTVTGIGIIENDFGNNLRIYPNPIVDHFSIDLGGNYQEVKINILDLNGRIIQSNTYSDRQLFNLKLEQPAGVYMLLIETESKKAIIRLIKE